MRHLGIDYGEKRVGVALSDTEGKIAFPHSVLKNDRALFSFIKQLCEKENVSALVVGESRDFKGNPNEIMKEIENFIEVCQVEIGLPVFLEPEFMTTVQAKRLTGKNEMTDASAAAIILQSYLDKKANI